MAAPFRILTVFGTRPEAIKLVPLLRELAGDERFDSRICITRQHTEMLGQVLAVAAIEPHRVVELERSGQGLDELVAALLTGIGSAVEAEQPDMVLVQGDTATAMAGALSAYHRKVPVAHVEAGLRSGDTQNPWPEELNRRIISAIACLHFAPTRAAAEALLAENVPASTVHVTGNTVIDALHWITACIERQPDLAGRMGELERRFSGRRIIGVTAHRRESRGGGMAAIADAVAGLARRPHVGIVFPVHLNPAVRGPMRERLGGLDNVALVEPLNYAEFARLLAISTLMLTDSEGVQEEAPALGTPVLVMRETTERPEGVEAGAARLVGTDASRILEEAVRLLEDESAYARMAQARNPYGDGRAAERIVGLLAGRAAARG